MSTATDDPFANLDESAVAAATADVDVASYFSGGMTIGEEEFDQPEEFRPYTMPPNGSWVPVKIISAEIEKKTQAFLVPDGEGKKRVNAEVDRFKLECEHVSTAYGVRKRPYLLSTPVFDLEMPKAGGSWMKTSGRKLIAAARVLDVGDKVTVESLPELAKKMVGKIILVQIKYSDPKEYKDTEPRKSPEGGYVKAKVDSDEEYIRVVEAGGQLVMEKGDVPCPMPKESLIPFKADGKDFFLIPDPDGRIVKDTTVTNVVFDNLRDDVAPVPNRKIVVLAADGETETQGKVTWETIGRLATKGRKVGTEVSYVPDSGSGETLVASWTGLHWAAEQKSGLDVFKGDN